MSKNKGFTLVELGIVVAIIGILAAVAIPSYMNYMKKVTRNKTTAKIAEIALQLERNYTVCNAYNLDCFNSRIYSISDQIYPDSGRKWFYNITVQLEPESFNIIAYPQERQSSDTCGTLWVNNLGEKRAGQGTMIGSLTIDYAIANHCF